MKPCPFCAEQIQDAAIKCRFCGSMLNGGAASPTGAAPATLVAAGAPHAPARVLFEGNPSWKSYFWPNAGAIFTTVVGIGLAILLGVTYGDQGPWVALAGVAVAVGGIVWFVVERLRRGAQRMRVTSETIDIERGILGKRIVTIQLWRVRDIDFRQSLFERLLGVATIHVVSHDVENPNIVLRGIPNGRELFNEMRDQIAIARAGRNVVGMVE